MSKTIRIVLFLLSTSFLFTGCGNALLGLHDYLFGSERILLAGSFTNIENTGKNFLAYLDFDGILRSNYASPTANISDIAVGPYGDFYVSPNVIDKVLHYSKNGTILSNFDTSGITGTNIFEQLAIQQDGKIIVTNNVFNVYRLNQDGSVDPNFTVFNTGSTIRDVQIQSDGKILLGGDFSYIQGSTTWNYLLRLNSDGTFDPTFASAQAAGLVYLIKLIENDNFFISTNTGDFFLLDSNGKIDYSFSAPTFTGGGPIVFDCDYLKNGNLIVVGNFTAPAPYVAELTSNGSYVGNPFAAGNTVFQVEVNNDGTVFLTGNFTTPTNYFYAMDENYAPLTQYFKTFGALGVTSMSLIPEADLP